MLRLISLKGHNACLLFSGTAICEQVSILMNEDSTQRKQSALTVFFLFLSTFIQVYLCI